jgi:hypothetical protein
LNALTGAGVRTTKATRTRMQTVLKGTRIMDKEILIEALEIAKNSFDYDAEYHKAEAVEEYIKQLQEEGYNE